MENSLYGFGALTIFFAVLFTIWLLFLFYNLFKKEKKVKNGTFFKEIDLSNQIMLISKIFSMFFIGTILFMIGAELSNNFVRILFFSIGVIYIIITINKIVKRRWENIIPDSFW